MKIFLIPSIFAMLLTAPFWEPPALVAGPLNGSVYLVAGSGSPGFIDGAFNVAEFSGPSSIVQSPDRKFLYLSDTGNNALRVVYLDEDCRVSTLAKGLKHPGRLRLGPGAKALYFLDSDGLALRSYTFASKKVTTVVNLGALSGGEAVSCFDFNSAGTGIYFTRSMQNSLLYAALDGSVTKTVAVDSAYGVPHLSFHVTKGHFLYFRPDIGQVFGMQEEMLGGPRPVTPVSLIGPAAGFFSCDKADDGTSATLLGFDSTLNSLRFLSVPSFVKSSRSLEDLRGITLNEIGKSPRPLLMGVVGLTYDFKTMTTFVAEPLSNRVMGFRNLEKYIPQAPNLEGLRTFSYSAEKQHGVTRNVLVGSSIAFISDSNMADQLLPKQLEEYWNLFNYLGHRPEREEVIFQGDHMGFQAGAGLSFAMGYSGSWTKVHADRILLTVTYLDVVAEAMSFMNAATPDDIAPTFTDKEWVTKSEAEKDIETGPLSLAFKNSLRKKITSYSACAVLDPKGGIDDPGSWNQQNLFRDREMKNQILAIYRHRLQAFKTKAAKAGCEIVGVLIPVRNQLSLAEMRGGGRNFDGNLAPALIDDDLRRIFESQGLKFISLTTDMRVLDASYFPLVKYSDDHYNVRGHHWLGLTLAWKLSEMLKVPFTAVPPKNLNTLHVTKKKPNLHSAAAKPAAAPKK